MHFEHFLWFQCHECCNSSSSGTSNIFFFCSAKMCCVSFYFVPNACALGTVCIFVCIVFFSVFCFFFWGDWHSLFHKICETQNEFLGIAKLMLIHAILKLLLLPTSRAGSSIHLYARFFSLDSEQIGRCKRSAFILLQLWLPKTKRQRFRNETYQKDILWNNKPHQTQSFGKYFLKHLLFY